MQKYIYIYIYIYIFESEIFEPLSSFNISAEGKWNASLKKFQNMKINNVPHLDRYKIR